MTTNGISILVATTKGVFLVAGNPDRDGWAVSGPFCDGWSINHVVGDAETGTIWAGVPGAAWTTGPRMTPISQE